VAEHFLLPACLAAKPVQGRSMRLAQRTGQDTSRHQMRSLTSCTDAADQ
jgi:hypothetical protein